MPDISVSTAEQIARAFSEHRREVRNFLHGQLRCRHTADDLTQETYLRLMRNAPTESVRDWRALIFRVARNLAIDYLRGRGRRHVYEQDLERLYEVTDERPEMDEALVTEEDLQRLETALEALPAQSRQVFELSRYEGLSHPQIAERLGTSARTVARHMALAVRRLRQKVQR